MLNESAAGSNRMQSQMELADAYSALDVGRSFAILAPLVSRLNELIAAAVVLDGFDNRYLKDGEWVNGAGSVGSLVNNVGEKLASLAHLTSTARLRSRTNSSDLKYDLWCSFG